MKKSILFLSIIASLVACKKAETTNSENQNATDSTSSAVPKTENIVVPEKSEKTDSATTHISEIKNIKENISGNLENQVKIIDTVSKAISKVELKSVSEPKKQDTTKEKQPEKIVQVKITPPKIYKETKIIYKNLPVSEPKISKNLMQKNATMEISVDDVSTAKELAKYEIRKNDGTIKSENLQSNDDMQVSYMKVKVPLQKFEYLLEDLSAQNIGKVENKNIEVLGNDYAENTMCNLELTIYNRNSDKALTAISKDDETFAGKSFSAISSGWNVLENIFLFLLPFWPIYLIALFFYFHYKDKKSAKQEITESE